MALQYPLSMSFKLIALAPRIIVRDATEREILYVHQRTFKLKEDVRIYSDQSKSQQLYQINADRIFDFSAKYTITGQNGTPIGALKHRGMRSIWNSTYEISNDAGVQEFITNEDNPMIKVLDYFANMIDIVSLFTGYFLNPSYTIYRGAQKEGGEPVMQLKKQPAFFESKFIIEKLSDNLDNVEEQLLTLCIIMIVQMERSRG